MPQTERAVADETAYEIFRREQKNYYCDPTPEKRKKMDDAERDYRDTPYPSEPRAVVAISEDRQWAVLPSLGSEGVPNWNILHQSTRPPTWVNTDHTWSVVQTVGDTGQDAEDVLREFLEGRET